MKDLSEIQGGAEQAQPTAPRAKPAARPKAEHTTSSQEQETKPAPRRRSTSTSQAPAATPPQGDEQASPAQSAPAPAAPAPTTRPAPQGAPQQRSSAPRNTGPTAQRSGPPPQRGGNTGGPPPQRSSGPGYSGPPPQRSGGPGYSGPPPQRSGGPGYGGPPRSGGPGYAPRNSGPGAPPTQRSGGPGFAPRNSGPGAPPAQRSGGPGFAPSAPGGQRSYGPPRERSDRGSSGPPSSRQQGGSGPRTYGPSGGTGTGQRPPQRGGGRPGGQRPPARSTNGPRTAQERRAAQVKEKPTGPVSIPPQIVVKDLAELLQTSPIEIIRNLIKNGIFASINQVVDYEQAATVAKEIGFEPSALAATTNSSTAVRGPGGTAMLSNDDAQAIEVPPVVTIMGHVDHGKTSLLDMIRKTKVAAGEAGGITQHIGAYQVETNGKKITFLDTPGHEAFTAMRARGAQVAHIAIIVIAADDGMMPQTREAIDHAQAAKMPLIIALNKIDKPTANPDRVKQQLADIGILVEEYGGQTICVPVSAKKGEGIDELLEYILLVAEIQVLRANPSLPAVGTIIEARLEKNTGATATVLVQQGTLKMGDNIVVGTIAGKVRAMTNDLGKRIMKAPPSTPVSILGLSEVPQAGDRLEATLDERTAKQRATLEAEKRKNETGPLGRVSLDTLYMQMQEGKVKELNIILKCDVQGSAEALKNALSKLGEENLKVRMIREGIGNIGESDIHLAEASSAIIIGFNVKADGAAQREAQKSGVDIRYYSIIYKLTEDIEAALKGMLEPTYREVIDGHAEVLQTFKAGKSVIAGCRITDGKIVRSSQVRLLRKGEKAFDGKIASLRRGKDDVREVLSGYECGILLEDFNAFEVGDIIEAFSQERVQPGA